MKIIRIGFFSVLIWIALTAGVYADETADAINEALQQYQKGEYTGAMGSLNYASQLIGQKKGEQLRSFLPKPLEGWTADDAASQVANTAMMGGGVSAERSYHKDSSSVTIRITSDSPMLQGMMMMLSNPMFAGADGGKMEKISGEKAIIKYNAANKDGNINIVVANRMLVTIEGNSVTEQDLKDYALSVEYKKLSAIP